MNEPTLADNLIELYEMKLECARLRSDQLALKRDIAKISQAIFGEVNWGSVIVTPSLLMRGIVAISSEDGDCDEEDLIEFLDAMTVSESGGGEPSE